MSDQNFHIHITGIVQGVGFRPYIYNLARKHNLTGWVCNTARGVEIEISGIDENIEAFLQNLQSSPPPLAEVDTVTIKESSRQQFDSFSIHHSQDQISDFMPVSPDIAICAECQHELFDPSDRRYRYPFINCTNCGPRFTITKQIPYDRPNTSMAGFKLCPECQREYDEPLDRRFHAQPVACPACGPQVWFEADGVRLAEKDEAIQMARKWLRGGKILAIKGLGGFHLACDAGNSQALQTLRERKHRTDKPFALMSNDLDTIGKYVELDKSAKSLLLTPQAPIVLLPIKQAGRQLIEKCAPHQSKLGFMLPYTPLHLLLMEPAPDFPPVLVMTSANLSEEPIAYQNAEALQRLNKLADGFLMHDRPIHMRVDDSVFARVESKPYPIRRARGFAPNPIRVTQDLPPTLGTGPLLKNTFCLSRERYAFVSHYIGDLENYETLQSYQQAIRHYEVLFRIKPEVIACDMHPDYLATRFAKQRSQDEGLPLIQVQHHHAHIAACLAENQWDSDEPVIGLSFDGTGYGSDGNIWGGEVLVAGYKAFERHFHLSEMPLPGGDSAIRKPARMALSYMIAAGLPLDSDLPPLKAFTNMEINAVKHQIEHQINAPLTTSMGRLFDAISALIGIRLKINYEAQAAIELEAIADPHESGYYVMPLDGKIIQTEPLIKAIVTDFNNKIPVSSISAKFHQTIINMALEVCHIIRQETGIQHIALSGGVWQNLFLLKRILPALRLAGFEPLIHQKCPPNDACISLGQVMIAAHQL